MERLKQREQQPDKDDPGNPEGDLAPVGEQRRGEAAAATAAGTAGTPIRSRPAPRPRRSRDPGLAGAAAHLRYPVGERRSAWDGLSLFALPLLLRFRLRRGDRGPAGPRRLA